MITVHDPISVHLVHFRALNPIAIMTALMSAHLVIPYCNNYPNAPISVHLVHFRALNPIALITDALGSARLVIPYCNAPAKWSRTVLECSKIILEFSRTMF